MIIARASCEMKSTFCAHNEGQWEAIETTHNTAASQKMQSNAAGFLSGGEPAACKIQFASESKPGFVLIAQ